MSDFVLGRMRGDLLGVSVDGFDESEVEGCRGQWTGA